MDREAVRAMTYNVRRDYESDAPYDWAGRHAAVASTVRFHRPDVVGLQEPLAHQYDDLRDALDEFAWVGKSRGADEREDEFCPVGYRRDRFTLLDSGTFWLSETPDEPGRPGWDARLPRVTTWVRLRDDLTGESLCYVNTHLDHEGDRARSAGARLIVDRLPGLRGDAPAVVAGDCNCLAGEKPYDILAGNGDESESPLTDARLASTHPPHGPDTTRTDFESLRADRRIDHVFVDGFGETGYGVAADQVGDGWYPSDHLPVVVDLRY